MLTKKANVTEKTISRIEGTEKGERQSTLFKVFVVLTISEDQFAYKIRADLTVAQFLSFHNNNVTKRNRKRRG